MTYAVAHAGPVLFLQHQDATPKGTGIIIPVRHAETVFDLTGDRAGVPPAYQFQGGMADQEGRRRRFRRTGPFSGVTALPGTTSLRMTGHSASHAAQHHSRMTVGPLSVCCKLTLPTCRHLGQTRGTNKEKCVGRISRAMMCSRERSHTCSAAVASYGAGR